MKDDMCERSKGVSGCLAPSKAKHSVVCPVSAMALQLLPRDFPKVCNGRDGAAAAEQIVIEESDEDSDVVVMEGSPLEIQGHQDPMDLDWEAMRSRDAFQARQALQKHFCKRFSRFNVLQMASNRVLLDEGQLQDAGQLMDMDEVHGTEPWLTYNHNPLVFGHSNAAATDTSPLQFSGTCMPYVYDTSQASPGTLVPWVWTASTNGSAIYHLTELCPHLHNTLCKHRMSLTVAMATRAHWGGFLSVCQACSISAMEQCGLIAGKGGKRRRSRGI